ncbi:MAG TPA: hypothetical protein ENN87_03760 [Phycisphaerales bacterium]|nr:hypothetical protein [Phycisphaerales bacterium]
MNPDPNSQTGKQSLCLAIAGLILPLVLALPLAVVEWLIGTQITYVVCGVLFLSLETAAVITGIIGRNSAYGKAGLALSVGLLVLAGLAAPTMGRYTPVREPGGTPQTRTGNND